MSSHRELNSVVQIIATQSKPAFSHMVAGSGWFPADYEEGIIITNAHVVNGSEAIFIRMPCAHTTDVRVYVRGISTDLDIAVLYLLGIELLQNRLYSVGHYMTKLSVNIVNC